MALRPETADWETRIEIEKGPSESTAAKVVFGHGDIMADLLSDWNKDSPISRFNKEQPTHLELQRVVSYYSSPYDSTEDVTTVFEHTDSFYNHICGEAFSIRSSFSVVDELSLGDFPKGWEGHEEDLSLSYRVSIKSTDGEPLDYDFGDPDISLPYINSFYCATVSYSVSKDGVGFYIKEDKKE
ncbi:MAG: hypothetical protein IJS37_03080 [Bacilli bacterium]|nr:hypothetical protein [Bacilli bacterium]